MFNLLRSVVAGYLMATLIVRRIERRSVAAHRAMPQGAARRRKAILFLPIAILATFVLHSASIPVTASYFPRRRAGSRRVCRVASDSYE